jgi:predicted nucleic acid-binding protein
LSVIVDANLLVALALNDPRAPAVDRHLREWGSAGETLHAPELLRYEAANALTRAGVAGHLTSDRLATAWERITRQECRRAASCQHRLALSADLAQERDYGSTVADPPLEVLIALCERALAGELAFEELDRAWPAVEDLNLAPVREVLEDGIEHTPRYWFSPGVNHRAWREMPEYHDIELVLERLRRAHP